MYEINERIKELRKTLDLSQAAFGEALHVSRDVIKNIDNRLVEPKPLFLDNIISTFNVNPEWLLDGKGEMFRELTKNEKVAQFIGEALADKPDSFKLTMIELLADLEPEDWAYLEKLARKLADKMDTKKEDSG